MRLSSLWFCVLTLSIGVSAQNNNSPFTLEAIKSYPFPDQLTAAGTGSHIAWAFNEEGLRNIYVAEGPDFQARRLTAYLEDDGQALSSVRLSADGKWVVYVRGGDFGSNWNDALPVNPTFSPDPPKVQIWSISFDGGEPILLGEGESPAISPRSEQVAFVKDGQIWTTAIDGSTETAKLFSARGNNGSPVWSPDGRRLAFQSNRGDHSFIGIYTDAETPLQWVAPSYKRDGSPRWSPNGNRLAFIRRPGSGGKPQDILEAHHNPWKVMTADLQTGKAEVLWEAPKTLRGSLPTTHGRTNLHWAAGRIVFLSYHDGWPHLYSVDENGGEPLLLTPGNFMAEHIQLSSDGKWLVFTANTGPDPLDIDRRHVVKVPVDRAAMEVMTPGDGLEWYPVVTGDGKQIAFIGATSMQPPLPGIVSMQGGQPKILASDRIPAKFPARDLVTPKQVVFQSPDGLDIHAQVFENPTQTSNNPAIVYIHGGPPRQMLLGWHYSDYYANAYAMNQYLASQGFTVLAVNYRLGIGYGYEFHHPVNAGWRGASEYLDIKAAGEWLAEQQGVDPTRIGVYGGSYGGYLTAMALGRNSDVFAAGVDIHGVHDRTVNRIGGILRPNRYERAGDADETVEIAWKSSPVAYIDSWKSPVLIIHGDDDRNVRFSESTDLVRRLEEAGIEHETMVIVDDTHHFMLHANAVKVNNATADFLRRKLLKTE